MDAQWTVRSISWTTARSTSLPLCCGALLLPLRGNRRKPDYSGTIDDVAQRIEPRSVTRAVPGLLGTVPVHNAVKVGAHCGTLVDAAPLVAINGDFSSTAPDNGALAGFDRIDLVELA